MQVDSGKNLGKILEAIKAASEANPAYPIGKLMEMAASIAKAELNQRASSATDEQILFGLRALVPDPEDGL